MQRLNDTPKDPAADTLIATATSLIKTSSQSTIDDELKFIHVIAAREDKEKLLPGIMVALETKYANDPLAGGKLYMEEYNIYQSVLKDPSKQLQALQKADDCAKEAQIDQAIEQLNLYLQVGDGYRGQSDPTKVEENKQKALSYYQKVIDFPLVKKPYWDSAGKFSPLYTKAALRIVELTEMRKMDTLYFYPFAMWDIRDQFPRKAGLIKVEDPQITEFREHLIRWLEASAKGQPAGSPLPPQFEAILKYVQTQD